MDGLLDSIRVLDLTDEKGLLCGRILGDMGADIITVESPAGNSARTRGPFYKDVPHHERSLFWFTLNSNKRGITLNLETVDGRELFKKLVKTADFVIESFPPGQMDTLGLGYDILHKLNPSLVMTSITPFGPDGPCADYKGSDIVIMGLGGLSYISGEPTREPIRIPVPQSFFHAGSWAAAASMVAFYHREITGEGQHVDVSMQQAATWATYTTQEWWSYAGMNLTRQGIWRQIGTSRMQVLFPCRDGYVMLFLVGGAAAAPGQDLLIEWMDREGLCPDWLRGFNFSELDVSTASQDFFDDLSHALADFTVTKTKGELFEWALKNTLFLAPVSNAEDLLKNPQLQSRNFWVSLDHPEIDASVTYPGPFALLSETPIRMRRRAPLLGEHNMEIYNEELRISQEEMMALKGKGVI
ncbi:MAG: CoA transferase [Thermodesulfobacteriota bacterium]|nr:CoA transferase [Thermodesulfobacteriota bacterium]